MRLLFFLTLIFCSATYAQSTNGLLIKNGSEGSPEETGLQSGRYQIKNANVPDDNVAPVLPKKKNKAKRTTAGEDAEKPKINPKNNPILPTEEKVEAVSQNDPDVSDHIRDLVKGSPREASQTYKEQIHSDDIRMNTIEVDVKPGLLYNGSTSNFSYRTYSSFSPYVDLGAQFWITPLIGISGKFGNSFSADISSNNSSKQKVAVKYENIEMALDFRKFFGMSRKSNSISTGLHYMENKMLAPSDDLTRMRLKTSGLGLHVGVRIPTAPSYAWTLGALVEPRLTHTEQATGINAQSGSSPDSSRMGFNVGGEFKMSRQQQMTWNLSISSEKNLFSGTSFVNDPETGATVSGVSVTNTTCLFTVGYRWGQ